MILFGESRHSLNFYSIISARHGSYRIGYVALTALTMLATACRQAAEPTSTLEPTLVASLTPSSAPDIQQAVEGTLTALGPTAPPDATFAPDFTLTPTPTLIVVTIPALTGDENPPPLDMTLPDGWQSAYNMHVLTDPSEPNRIRAVPIAVYSGPIEGGTGTIVVYWGFGNLVNPLPAPGTPVAIDLWSDGLLLLRQAVVEPQCNIGTDLKRTYRIGLVSAVGTEWSAVTCPELPDTRGWFAGVTENRINFVFYAFADPISAMDTGADELQTILDSVRFRVPELTATPEVSPTP
jgi:hypothetical protein